MSWWSAGDAEKAIGVGGTGQQDRHCEQGPAMIAKPVGRCATDGQKQIMPKADVVAVGLHRLGEEVRDQPCEQHHRDPIEESFHPASRAPMPMNAVMDGKLRG